MYNDSMISPFVILAGVIVFFVLILSIIIGARQKRKKEVWAGIIEDKKVITETRKDEDFDRKVDVYYLFIKLSGGTSKKLSVGKKLYDSFAVGDKIEKKAGMYDPVKA